jgi:hypothetical protein
MRKNASCTAGDAFSRGFRHGLRGVLRVGCYEPAPPVICRSVGSLLTDRRARYRDMNAFKADVRRGHRVVI